MPQPDLALPLSRYSLFHTQDVDQARERVARIFCPHVLSTCSARDRLDARHHSAPLGPEASLNYVQYGSAVDIDPGHLGSFFLLQIPLRGHASVWCGGREVQANAQLASLPSPTESLRMRWAADSPHLIVRFTQRAAREQLEQLAQGPVHGDLVFDPAVRLDLPGVRTTLGLLRHLCETLDADPDFAGSLLARQAESYLISSLLLQLPHNQAVLLEAGARRALLPRTVRRAQDYMREHATEALTLVQLCRELAVSARSLQQAFVAATGETPMGYWRNLRLDRARQELAAADATDRAVVGQVAGRYGFFHAGHFAAHYQRRFGERPVDTLRVMKESARRR